MRDRDPGEQIVNELVNLIDAMADMDETPLIFNSHPRTFEESGLLTRDHGVVLRPVIGGEVQLTLVWRRSPDAEMYDNPSELLDYFKTVTGHKWATFDDINELSLRERVELERYLDQQHLYESDHEDRLKPVMPEWLANWVEENQPVANQED